MKNLHVHLHVDDLGKSISFHSKLFAAARAEAAPCSTPMPRGKPVGVAIKSSSSCC